MSSGDGAWGGDANRGHLHGSSSTNSREYFVDNDRGGGGGGGGGGEERNPGIGIISGVDGESGGMEERDTEEDEEELERLTRYSDSEEDYYSLLGLPRNPTPSDSRIRSAYHRLSLSFHPDKQPPHLRAAASQQYARIQRAHDTLLDPQKRVVYDMLGAEGVKAQWSNDGVMGRHGEAQEQQLGIKAMTSKEFRAWFLARMKSRERDELQHMVGSRTNTSIFVNAIPLFQWMKLAHITENDPAKSTNISRFDVRHSFRVPTTWLEPSSAIDTVGNVSPYQTHGNSDFWSSVRQDVPETEFVIDAGISGSIVRPVELANVHLENGEVFQREIEMEPAVIGKDFALGSSLYYPIPEQPSRSFQNDHPTSRFQSLLRGKLLGLEMHLLPRRSLHLSVTGHEELIPGTRPLGYHIGALCDYPIYKVPPVMSLGLTRGLTNERVVYASCAAPRYFWSDLPAIFHPLLRFFNFGPGDGAYVFEPGRATIGYQYFTQPDVETDGEGSTTEGNFQNGRLVHSAKESWGFQLDTHGGLLALSAHYHRNVFGGPIDTPVLSAWSASDYHAPDDKIKVLRQFNPVRLELSGNIKSDGTFEASVSGNRRVGNFTRVGFGLLLTNSGSINITVTWSRLSQSLRLPVAISPPGIVNPDLLALSLAVPWATFILVEYGVLRPRAKKLWKQAVEERRKGLKRTIANRRAESERAIELMTSQVRRRQNEEAATDGLVIIRADYGARRSKKSRDEDASEADDLIDVTIPVAALVDNGQLSIPRRIKKPHILGFYDPAPLRRKFLRVRYRFRGDEHLVEIDENQNLVCPMKEHRLSSIHEMD